MKYHIRGVPFNFVIANPSPPSTEIVKRQFKPTQPPVEGYSFKWKWTFRETSYSMCWVLSARSRNSQLELCSTLLDSKLAGHLPASVSSMLFPSSQKYALQLQFTSLRSWLYHVYKLFGWYGHIILKKYKSLKVGEKNYLLTSK